MNDFIKILDNNLEYIRHEIENYIVKTWVMSNKSDLKCPHCNSVSNKVHFLYERDFQDLPKFV